MVSGVNMKTPEEMAEEYIRYENESAYWTKHAFLAGYKAAQEWISVKDRLPEIEQSSFAMRKESACVLIVSNGDVHVAHLCEKWCDRTQLIFEACDCDCRGHDMEQDEWELDQVTDWMPLPEPPKEEK
jgi:hypothetical protein